MQPAQSSLQSVVEQRIGRNLLRYQLVELRLKVLLPLNKVELSMDGLANLRQRSKSLRKQTLGQLSAVYLEQGDPGDVAARQQRLNAFVDARNWLTHHLLASHGALKTDHDCQTCIERLDRDYEAAALVAGEILVTTRVTIKMLNAFMDAWVEAGEDLSEGTQLMASLERHLRDEAPAHVDVTLETSVESILAMTMRKLHADRKDADGWTPFANVGTAARRASPNLPKGLLAIARTIEGFEFEQRPAGSPNAGWMFRASN